MNKKIMSILDAREERVCFQEEIMEKYKNSTLISVRVNYPGEDKITVLSKNIYFCMEKILLAVFKNSTELTFFRIASEGPIGIFVIDKDSEEVKKICIKIEDSHPLGRFVDIDVYNNKTKQGLSRTEFGFEARKCYLCDNIAQACVRSRKHNIKEIIEYMEEEYENFVKYRR